MHEPAAASDAPSSSGSLGRTYPRRDSAEGTGRALLPAGAVLTDQLREETARLQRSLDAMKATLTRSARLVPQDGEGPPLDIERPHSSDSRRRSPSQTSLSRTVAGPYGGPRLASADESSRHTWRLEVRQLVLRLGQGSSARYSDSASYHA